MHFNITPSVPQSPVLSPSATPNNGNDGINCNKLSGTSARLSKSALEVSKWLGGVSGIVLISVGGAEFLVPALVLCTAAWAVSNLIDYYFLSSRAGARESAIVEATISEVIKGAVSILEDVAHSFKESAVTEVALSIPKVQPVLNTTSSIATPTLRKKASDDTLINEKISTENEESKIKEGEFSTVGNSIGSKRESIVSTDTLVADEESTVEKIQNAVLAVKSELSALTDEELGAYGLWLATSATLMLQEMQREINNDEAGPEYGGESENQGIRRRVHSEPESFKPSLENEEVVHAFDRKGKQQNRFLDNA